MTAGGRANGGRRGLPIYHNDHSRPEKPVIRSLEEEIGRVVRGRVVNPKWIDGVMRHGYKGAFEMAATVDYHVCLRRDHRRCAATTISKPSTRPI